MAVQIEVKLKRDTSIDTLRGIAILTMVAADLAASVLKEPHPFWFRLYGSWAAPMFILLSGFMIAYTSEKKKYNFRHFLANPSISIYKPLQVLGQSSLFIYILHYAIIVYVISNLLPKNDILNFLGIYIVLAGSLILIAYGLRTIKQRWKNSPYFIRFIIGS